MGCSSYYNAYGRNKPMMIYMTVVSVIRFLFALLVIGFASPVSYVSMCSLWFVIYSAATTVCTLLYHRVLFLVAGIVNIIMAVIYIAPCVILGILIANYKDDYDQSEENDDHQKSELFLFECGTLAVVLLDLFLSISTATVNIILFNRIPRDNSDGIALVNGDTGRFEDGN